MQQSNQPPKYVIPFAQNDASKATIPPTSADATRASQSVGFPPRTGLPPEAGGVPPQKADMNGALNQLAGPILWALAGGRFPFDNAFATDANIGGYPASANVPAADGRGEWYSTANDNTTNPDTVGTGWVPGYHYGATALAGQTGGNVTLTPAQAGKRVITVAGTLTSNLVLIVPAWVYSWTIYNNTSGAFSVSVRTAAGSAAAIPQNGAPTPVNCDGTNCSLTAANIGPATSGTQAARLDQLGGRLLNTQVFTASGTYTPTPGTTRAKATVVGGGGGGGASNATGAGQAACGVSGGGGGWAIGWVTVSFGTAPVTVGAAGAAGLPQVSDGTSGTASSFAGLTGGGGGGGANGNAAATPTVYGAANGGTGAGGSLINGNGSGAANGISASAVAVIAGASGGSLFGGSVGFGTVSGSAPGRAGGAPGAGGCGAAGAQNATEQPGGAGAGGIVIIEEYA
jgi:hypothetical protein